MLFLNPQPATGPGNTAPALFGPGGLQDIYEANAAERLNELLAYSGMRTGNLLLIGADEHLRAEAQKRGFTVHILTPHQFESATGQDLPQAIDACVLFCALERMRDPLSALRVIRGILSPNGSLMLIAPTSDSKAARLLKTSWWEFSRENLYYFSVDTLQNLLIKAGFGYPIISPERTLASINYLRQKLGKHAHVARRYRWFRRMLSVSPVLRNKKFRFPYGRTRVLVRGQRIPPKPVLSVIVPVYNERATFPELMDQLLAKSIEGVDIEILVIESNSTDGTRDVVLQYESDPRVRIILEDKPRGKGHAVRAGLKAAAGNLVLIQDGDLEYDVNDYDALVQPMLRYQSNFVLGSRHIAGKNSWKIRSFSSSPLVAGYFNLGHYLLLNLFNVVYSQNLTDPFTMFKVFRTDCIYGLRFECDRFDFDNEIVIKLIRKGYKPLEIPVNYVSRSIQEGKKITLFMDPLRWIRALFKFRKSPLYDRPSISA